MNILFIGTTGVHHTLIAACLYLNRLNGQSFNELEFWDDRYQEATGLPLFLGSDDRGNKVYVLGVGWEVVMAKRTLEQLDQLLNKEQANIMIEPIFIKRERVLLLLHRLGRFRWSRLPVRMLVAYFLQKEFLTIQNQVEKFRARVRFG